MSVERLFETGERRGNETDNFFKHMLGADEPIGFCCFWLVFFSVSVFKVPGALQLWLLRQGKTLEYIVTLESLLSECAWLADAKVLQNMDCPDNTRRNLQT